MEFSAQYYASDSKFWANFQGQDSYLYPELSETSKIINDIETMLINQNLKPGHNLAFPN